jgi:polyadenylate-binding protein
MSCRVDDDAALRAKVDEALTVYDEYMKNKGGDGEGHVDATKTKDAGKEGSAESKP